MVRGEGRTVAAPVPAFEDVVEQGRPAKEDGTRPGPPHSSEGGRVMARATAGRAVSSALNADPAPFVPVSPEPVPSAGVEATGQNDAGHPPGVEEGNTPMPVIAKPVRPGPRADDAPQPTAPASAPPETPDGSEEAYAGNIPVTPMVREDRSIPEVPFGFTDERRMEKPVLLADRSATTDDSASGNEGSASPKMGTEAPAMRMADAADMAMPAPVTGVLQAPSRASTEENGMRARDADPVQPPTGERAAQGRDVAPVQASTGEHVAQMRDAVPAQAPTAERSARVGDATAEAASAIPVQSPPAPPDRNTTDTVAPRNDTPAPRMERVDPYSITATMNGPVSTAEAALTLATASTTASATPQMSATATSAQAVATAPAPPLAMAIPAMLPEASSKVVPEGMAEPGGDLPVGATMRGESPVDVRQAASPLRPATMGGDDALQEIVRAAVVTRGPTTIELRLDPSELGKLDIELSFVDDRVSIMVRGEREDALDLMRRSSDELGRMLRQAGLDLDTLNFARDQTGERDREQAFRAFAVEGAGEGEGVDPVRSALRLGPAPDRVDIRI